MKIDQNYGKIENCRKLSTNLIKIGLKCTKLNKNHEKNAEKLITIGMNHKKKIVENYRNFYKNFKKMDKECKKPVIIG